MSKTLVVFTILFLIALIGILVAQKLIDNKTISNTLNRVVNSTPTNNQDSCNVKSITKDQQLFTSTKLPFLAFKRDANGVTDIMEGTPPDSTCLTCNPPQSAPGAGKYKTLPVWMPNQKFIFFVAEADSHQQFSNNQTSKNQQIQNGWWGNLWAITPDGSKWYQLTNYSKVTDGTFFGVLAPIVSNNKVVWAKFIGKPNGQITMGGWKLYIADLVVNNDIPKLANVRDISAPNSTIFEPQDFSPDGSKFLVSQDTNMSNPYGWDTYEYDANTLKSVNLNNTPDQWDEHARYSPDGSKIVWATSSPYPSTITQVPYGQYAINYLKTEFWLMNNDGTNKSQLTHFNQSGYPETTTGKNIANVPTWNKEGTQILAGSVPFGRWVIDFTGNCGNQ